jgi:hypothetical protein
MRLSSLDPGSVIIVTKKTGCAQPWNMMTAFLRETGQEANEAELDKAVIRNPISNERTFKKEV